MSKYDLLGKFLREQPDLEVPMSFAEIEQVTGVNLPPKAQLQRAWWSNNPSNNVLTKVWLDAGFRSEKVDLEGKRLVFKRAVPEGQTLTGFSEPQQEFRYDTAPVTPQLRTPRRHPAFGALKGMLRIESGTDLTEPALPEWTDLVARKCGPEERK